MKKKLILCASGPFEQNDKSEAIKKVCYIGCIENWTISTFDQFVAKLISWKFSRNSNAPLCVVKHRENFSLNARQRVRYYNSFRMMVTSRLNSISPETVLVTLKTVSV